MKPIYALMGITGQVGGMVARPLLSDHQSVRALVRNREKAAAWADRGCELFVADVDDAASLARAFAGADGVFVMIPPDFDPAPGYPLIHQKLATLRTALLQSQPKRVVFLSTVGAQVEEPNLLHNSKIFEAGLRDLPMPVAFVRAGWFMENASWDVAAAKTGLLRSYLQPLDHAIPMVSVTDIGETIARQLQAEWLGLHVVELEGPRRYSANDLAAGFSAALGHPVRIEAIERREWEANFRSQGMKHPEPRMRMLDGFNAGWIDFERNGTDHRQGKRTLHEVLAHLVCQA